MEITAKVIAAPANVKKHNQKLLVSNQRALAGVLVLCYLSWLWIQAVSWRWNLLYDQTRPLSKGTAA